MKSHVSQFSRRYLLPGVTVAVMASASLLAACGEDSAEHNGSWQQQGQLLAWDRDVWIVGSVPIIMPASLDVADARTLGSHVDATGSYDGAGRMVAETVSLSVGSLPDSTLEPAIHEGAITSVSDSIWVVGETVIVVPDGLAISGLDGVDVPTLETGNYTATVTGHRFGENTIVASAIEVASANAQDSNSAPQRTPVIVEPSDDVEPTQEPEQSPPDPSTDVPAEAPADQQSDEPVREPDQSPPQDGEDDGDDGNGDKQRKEEKKPDKTKKDKKDD